MTLKTIATEMMAQSNRSTQSPMFAIMVDRKVFMPYAPGYDLERERKEEVDYNDLCQACAIKTDTGEDLPDSCDDCDDEAFNHFKLEDHLEVEMAGTFFTAKACQDHIDDNRHHYRNPRVYGIGSWRNPEMVAVQKHILSHRFNWIVRLFKRGVPSYYR